jgi:hypothetical protein
MKRDISQNGSFDFSFQNQTPFSTHQRFIAEERVVGKLNDSGVAGAFEELPVLLVVLVAVSLFSVSVAHTATSWSQNNSYNELQEDCLTLARMVRNSEALCVEGDPGTFDISKLQNITGDDFIEEFNPSMLGLGYRIGIQCIDTESGNLTSAFFLCSSEPPSGIDTAAFSSCINTDTNGHIGAARLSVMVWRLP